MLMKKYILIILRIKLLYNIRLLEKFKRHTSFASGSIFSDFLSSRILDFSVKRTARGEVMWYCSVREFLEKDAAIPFHTDDI